MAEPVRGGRRFCVGVAIAVTCGVFASTWSRPVPDLVLTAIGGPSGVERWGGLRVRYRPPAAANGAASAAGEDTAVLEYPGLPEAEVPALIGMLEDGVSMHVVRESDSAQNAAKLLGIREHSREGFEIQLDWDSWTAESIGGRHSVPYLKAATREALEQGFARAATASWQLPQGSVIGYEELAADEFRSRHWRSYELEAEVALDGSAIERAKVAEDPNIYRPVVLIDLTEDGAEQLCRITTSTAGRKLALTIGVRVVSSPILNGPICGGRVSISLGTGDTERDAAALAAALSYGELSSGVTIVEQTFLPPAAESWRSWVGYRWRWP